MANNKYEFTDETVTTLDGRILHRIKALKNLRGVNKGELGGFIETENNLNHDGDAWVSGNARIFGNARVSDNAWVSGNARIFGNARISGDALVYGNARISGNAWVSGNARISGNANIKTNNDILILSFLGSRLDTTTFFRTKNNEIFVNCGCFTGSIDQFLKQVEETHGTNKYGDEYRLAAQLAELHIHDEKREDK